MSDAQIELVAKMVFYGSIALFIFTAYREWKKSQIEAEEDEIEMGELENENKVNSLTPDELIALINDGKEPDSTKNNSNTKKPSS